LTESVVVLTPEPPYPLRGGGAFRIASLVHYFARFAAVDLIFISESGEAAELPKGLVRRQTVIQLPHHSRSLAARYWRNGARALRGIPPLVDRLAGLEDEIASALAGERYALGLVEHFWAAPYLPEMARACEKVILDLHNVESTLHGRCGQTSSGLVALGHRRFAARSRELERTLLPQYSVVLATSEEDRRQVREIAPGTQCEVYPNAYPVQEGWEERNDTLPLPNTVVFSGNFEYHPNIDGVRYLMEEIWPEILRRNPEATLRLVGKGDRFIRHLIRGGCNVEVTGPVGDAVVEISRGAVAIAPLRSGSGTRIKILEAWAAGRPVVATSLAAEGLAVKDGVNIALADDPKGFARAVCGLLESATLRRDLASGGESVLREKYTWEMAWKALDAIPQVTRYRELRSYTG
jgi:glycosyltransferase involved in cell wall biosynthesis